MTTACDTLTRVIAESLGAVEHSICRVKTRALQPNSAIYKKRMGDLIHIAIQHSREIFNCKVMDEATGTIHSIASLMEKAGQLPI